MLEPYLHPLQNKRIHRILRHKKKEQKNTHTKRLKERKRKKKHTMKKKKNFEFVITCPVRGLFWRQKTRETNQVEDQFWQENLRVFLPPSMFVGNKANATSIIG